MPGNRSEAALAVEIGIAVGGAASAFDAWSETAGARVCRTAKTRERD